MRVLVAPILIAALLAHLALGCCAHHTHVEVLAGGCAAERLDDHGHDHHTRHHHGPCGDSREVPRDNPCPSPSCDEPTCVFSLTVAPKLPLPSSLWSTRINPSTTLTGQTAEVDALMTGEHRFDTVPAPPVRAYLLLSVMLL